MKRSGMAIFSGTSNIDIANKITKNLSGIKLGSMEVKRFADKEVFVRVNETVRDKDTFVIQSTSNPANENWMELYLIIDALRRASAKRITTVLPYYGYSRQDRKSEPRVAISAKLVANLLAKSGTNRILTLDLHAAQLQGYFDIPVDHLQAYPVFLDRIKKLDISNMIIVSPDIGGVVRSREFASFLDMEIAIIDKRRPKANHVEVMNIIGDVSGKDAVIIDDIIDTGGTLIKGAKALKNAGMKKIYVVATHGVLSNDAMNLLQNSEIEKIFITDSIYHEDINNYDKIEVVSVSKIIAKTIDSIHREESVGKLFMENQYKLD